MADLTIDGKSVTLRDAWTGRAAFRAGVALDALSPALKDRDALRAHADSAYDSYVTLCRAAITAWELDGDPADPAAYEALPMATQWELFGAVLAVTARELIPSSDEKKE